MTKKSEIEWTEYTINFYLGCKKVSEGCQNCYMFRLEKRWGKDPTELRKTNWDNIERKLRKIEPSVIFANSMTDMFIEQLSDIQIKEMFDIMEKYSQHKFQVLTKRADRLYNYSNRFRIPENIWIGVSVESAKYISRINHLRNSNVKTKFISFEPLIGDIGNNIELHGIDWVIVGGESDMKNPREMKESWVQNILINCKKENVPFFFKQWGGKKQCACHKTWGCRLFNGKTYDEMPESFEREFLEK